MPIKLRESILSAAEALLNDPVLPPRYDPDADDSGFVLTGESTINLIVESIRQNQAVVLSGPRGCGKSYCVRQAIKRAAAEGVILPGAKVELQGNREFPRDYLMEDSLVLRTHNGTVVPEMVSAPLFNFAKRDKDNNKPMTLADDKVVMNTRKNLQGGDQTVDRFVLFLDEINRFSDGVLDSLLSVLEERQAILAGETYRLPVVVLMTMNPPGYDGTARRLSPPLQARIGRNWRLYSPDLRTQSNLLIPERRKKILESILDEKWTAERAKYPERAKFVENLLGSLTVTDIRAQVKAKNPSATSKEFALLHEAACVEALISKWQIDGVDGLPSDLCRRAAMVCICLWGIPRTDETAHTYLTKGTRAMLTALAKENHLLRDAMTELLDLCTYGPDGRAAPDWVQAAYSLARRDNRSASVQKQHFRATLIDTLSHKLNDSFSPANEPEKEKRKHQAILRIFDEIFSQDRHVELTSYLSPLLENDQWLRASRKLWPDPCPDEKLAVATLRRMFEEAGLVDHEDHVRWMGDNPKELGGVMKDLVNKYETPVVETLLKHQILVGKDFWEFVPPEDSQNKPLAFASEGWKKFFELLKTKEGTLFKTSFTVSLCAILPKEQEHASQKDAKKDIFSSANEVPPAPFNELQKSDSIVITEVRPTIEKEVLAEYPVLRLYGSAKCFEDFVAHSGGEAVPWRQDTKRRDYEARLAKALTLVWEKATATNETGGNKNFVTTGTHWEESLHGQLGLAGGPAEEFMRPIHKEFGQLLDQQFTFARKLADQAWWYRFKPSRWLGRPFTPENAKWLPGDVKANLYRDGIQRLKAKIDKLAKTSP